LWGNDILQSVTRKENEVAKYTTQLLVDVEVGYDLLPAQENLPEQVDINSIKVHSLATNGRVRKISVLGALDESAIINLEDEILEALGS